MFKFAAAALGIAGAIGFAGVAFAGQTSDDATSVPAPAPVVRPTTLVESPNCSVPPSSSAQAPAVAVAAAGASSPSVTQTITVTVPPLAIIRLDAAGNVASAFTNTLCAPRSTDDVYLVDAGGTFLNADPVHELPEHTWVGDFTQPGVFQQQ
jgi:hypothetical protein